ncbi:DUF6632 domain-containing protein [Pelagibius sp. Alg239-R121]|uniref:DUF6632 domain-containing protein n=1 Tax=Pelagibius sp. Alg239-R121 TaxID=2993448 RepID=UPI0024A79B5D|nr:DUF6632 domain-containing protein [Pelagibius sp. Alg239-R121]
MCKINALCTNLPLLCNYVNTVHSVIMGFQSAGDHSERGHLVGDVPLLFIVSIIIWYSMPPKGAKGQITDSR